MDHNGALEIQTNSTLIEGCGTLGFSIILYFQMYFQVSSIYHVHGLNLFVQSCFLNVVFLFPLKPYVPCQTDKSGRLRLETVDDLFNIMQLKKRRRERKAPINKKPQPVPETLVRLNRVLVCFNDEVGDWLVGWFVSLYDGWLVDWFSWCLVGSLIDWLLSWLLVG